MKIYSEELKKIKLIDVFEIVLSGEWGEENLEDNENTAYIIRTTNFLNDGTLDVENRELVKRKISREKIDEKHLKRGDIIIEKSGGSPNQPVGRVVYFDIESEKNFLCNNFTSILRVKEGIEPKYIFYFLKDCYKKRIVLKYQNKTTGIINLKLQDYLKNTEIQLPNIEIQKKIVEILDKAFLINSLLIEKERRISELNKCLFSFATKRARKLLLNEVADITMGQSPDSKYYNTLKEGLPFFQGKTEFGENYIKEIKYYCSCPLKIAEENSILMSVRAPVGTVNISKVRCCIGRGLAAIIPKKIEMLYLFFALKNLEKEIERKGVGSTFKAITKKDIEKIEIPIIEIKDQVDFVNRILKIEKSKFEIQQSIDETQKLFDSLMEKYFG